MKSHEPTPCTTQVNYEHFILQQFSSTPVKKLRKQSETKPFSIISIYNLVECNKIKGFLGLQNLSEEFKIFKVIQRVTNNV